MKQSVLIALWAVFLAFCDPSLHFSLPWIASVVKIVFYGAVLFHAAVALLYYFIRYLKPQDAAWIKRAFALSRTTSLFLCIPASLVVADLVIATQREWPVAQTFTAIRELCQSTMQRGLPSSMGRLISKAGNACFLPQHLDAQLNMGTQAYGYSEGFVIDAQEVPSTLAIGTGVSVDEIQMDSFLFGHSAYARYRLAGSSEKQTP